MTTTHTDAPAPPARRPRGRPRDPRVEGAVVGATRDLLLEHGFGHLSIAGVAEAAGVGKGTIYLRWPDKESLVVAALAEVWGPVTDPDTGTLEGDLGSIMRTVRSHFNGISGRLLAAVVGEMPRHRTLQRLWADHVIDPWLAVMAEVFRRAVERGEMRAGIDPDIATDALLGPVLGITVVRGQRVTPQQGDVFLGIFLGGVARR